MARKGSQYRLCEMHPGEGRGPLERVTDKAGNTIVRAGQSCSKVPAKLLNSMIANGYVERIKEGK